MVEYILRCVNHYFGLSVNELKQLAYELERKLNLKNPISWDTDEEAGRKWYRLFMKRHPQLALRTPEQTSIHRVKAFCKRNVDHFFGNLFELLEKYSFICDKIFNMDESGFATVPTKIGQVIALKGVRRFGSVEAAEKGTLMTLAVTVSADGNSLPPFFVFPTVNMQSVFLNNTTDGTVGYVNGSVWMQQSEFTRFMRFFIRRVKPSVDDPVLLLLDNHSSHLTIEALDIAAANGVRILSFPPHCSHRLHPLDVSVFGPVKAYFKSQVAAWKRNHALEVLEMRHYLR